MSWVIVGFTGRWVGNPGDLLIRIQWDWDIHGFYMEFSMDSCNGDIPTVSWEIHELNRPAQMRKKNRNKWRIVHQKCPASVNSGRFFRGEKVVIKGRRIFFLTACSPLDRKIGKPPWPVESSTQKNAENAAPEMAIEWIHSWVNMEMIHCNLFPICVPRHIIWLPCTAFIGAAAAT